MELRTFQLPLKSRPALRTAAAGLFLSCSLAVSAQQQAPAPDSQPDAATNPRAATAPSRDAVNSRDNDKAGIAEEELKRSLVGRPLFLRGAYMSDSLTYSEHGNLVGSAKPAAFTLCAVQIDKVHLSRRKVELEGARYGLHFLGALAYEDPAKGVDRVKITPKKKSLKITIERELVVKPKKVKEPKDAKKKKNGSNEEPAPETANADTASSAEPEANSAKLEDQPADPNSVTTTTSPAHSAAVLRAALDRVFAESIDERMIAAMPDFWKFYYQAAAAKTDYRPADPAVLRQNMVDQKAKLVTKFEPSSNEWAQTHGVAGMSLYHVVIGADGKPGEIAVARPIGFGLDENAVDAIRTAKFEPAIKDGKPVPVMLDLVVQFRIFSKRTAVSGPTEASGKPAEPALPGPYSIEPSQ